MIAPAPPLAELTERAIHVLSREIGVANTMRFLGQFATGFGNYTEDREALFRDLTLDDILAEMRGSCGAQDRRDVPKQTSESRDLSGLAVRPYATVDKGQAMLSEPLPILSRAPFAG